MKISWDMKRSIGKKLSVLSKNLKKDTGKFVSEVSENSKELIKDVSRSISSIDLEQVGKDIKKSTRVFLKKINRMMNRGMKNFRKSELYESINNIPDYISGFSLWSLVQFRKMKNAAKQGYGISRKWVLKNYPKVQEWVQESGSSVKSWVAVQVPMVRNFIKENYPLVENFILTRLPLYRAAWGR
jgi:hypothetical protein